jgi:hypothetical protein
VYAVRLTVDGQEFTQSLTVLKDPNTAGTKADIAAQVAFLEAVREDVVTAGNAVRRVEVLRVQLQNLLTGQGQDGVRFGAQLLQKLGYLTRNVSVVDFPPTDQDMEVQQILRDQLAEHLSAIDALVAGDVADLNALLRSKGMETIGN